MKDLSFFQKTSILILVAMILSGFCFSIHNFSKLSGWEPVCIAKQCNSWAEGDEWISENCRPTEINNITVLSCEVVVNSQLYNLPLSVIKERINITDLRSCKKDGMICVKEVYIKEV